MSHDATNSGPDPGPAAATAGAARTWLIVVGLLIICFLLLNNMLFTIDQSELGLLTFLGDPVRVLDKPGLYFKWPDPIQSVHRFDARLMVLDARPAEVLTQDKKPLVYEAYACWRIADPRLFIRTVKDRRTAEVRLSSMLLSEVSDVLGKSELSVLLSVEPDGVQIEQIMQVATERCRSAAREELGVEVVDVGLRRFGFPEGTRASVYRRMRSERQRIAKKYRAEGEEEAEKIKAETDKEVSRILTEAYRDAEQTKGEGDAVAARIYAEAYSSDPELYKLTRTLESYRKFLDEQTVIVLDSDAEVLKLLVSGKVD
ncbi:MAG: protease modulator HflC [Candidatus Alcyoniella australis]|nr:protease modulator HflC [Candidatus Alcyoniella australis]